VEGQKCTTERKLRWGGAGHRVRGGKGLFCKGPNSEKRRGAIRCQSRKQFVLKRTRAVWKV